MTKLYFAVTVEYDHGVILSSDVEMALEDALGGPDHEVRVNAIGVGKRLHDRLESTAHESLTLPLQTLPGIVVRPNPKHPMRVVGSIHVAEVLKADGFEFELCDGALLNRHEYPELFEVIGTRFGAPDDEHFHLPDFRARVVQAHAR